MQFPMERLTDRARKVLSMAAVESQQLGHNYVGTEHILIAIVRAGGVGANVLKNLDVDCDKLIVELKKTLGEKTEPAPFVGCSFICSSPT